VNNEKCRWLPGIRQAFLALDILADCPNGATYPALAASGIHQEVLDRLVAEGKLTSRVEKVGTERKWFEIVRYFIAMPEDSPERSSIRDIRDIAIEQALQAIGITEEEAT